MKTKILTGISAAFALFPWTILPLRAWFSWALEYAHLMIPGYAALMILGGAFTALAYGLGKARSPLMKLCLVVNIIYAVFGAAVLPMLIWRNFPGFFPAFPWFSH